MIISRRVIWTLIGCWALRVTSTDAEEWLDLTYAFDQTTQYWPGFLPFNLSNVVRGQQQGGFWLEANNYGASEHGGTHMDAPAHFLQGGMTLDQIPVDRFIADAAVVDIEDRAQRDRDTILTPDDLANWRHRYGKWRYPTILLVRTGNAKHWADRVRYFGYENATQALHFPGIGAQAAELLAADPAIVGVGIDTPSIDPGTSANFPAHVTLFKAGKFGLENIADMSRVPAKGATILALPMKIGGGSGGPCRVLVRLPYRPRGPYSYAQVHQRLHTARYP